MKRFILLLISVFSFSVFAQENMSLDEIVENYSNTYKKEFTEITGTKYNQLIVINGEQRDKYSKEIQDKLLKLDEKYSLSINLDGKSEKKVYPPYSKNKSRHNDSVTFGHNSKPGGDMYSYKSIEFEDSNIKIKVKDNLETVGNSLKNNEEIYLEGDPKQVGDCESNKISLKNKKNAFGGVDNIELENDKMLIKVGNAEYKIYPKYVDDGVVGKTENPSDQDNRARKMETCVEVTGICKKTVTICTPDTFNTSSEKEKFAAREKLYEKSGACGNLKRLLDNDKPKDRKGKLTTDYDLRDAHHNQGGFNGWDINTLAISLADENGNVKSHLNLKPASAVYDERNRLQHKNLINNLLKCRDYFDAKTYKVKPQKNMPSECINFINKDNIQKAQHALNTENNVHHYSAFFTPLDDASNVLSISPSTSYFEKQKNGYLKPVECLDDPHRGRGICEKSFMFVEHNWSIDQFQYKTNHFKPRKFYNGRILQDESVVAGSEKKNLITFQNTPSQTKPVGKTKWLNVDVTEKHKQLKINECASIGGYSLESAKEPDIIKQNDINVIKD